MICRIAYQIIEVFISLCILSFTRCQNRSVENAFDFTGGECLRQYIINEASKKISCFQAVEEISKGDQFVRINEGVVTIDSLILSEFPYASLVEDLEVYPGNLDSDPEAEYLSIISYPGPDCGWDLVLLDKKSNSCAYLDVRHFEYPRYSAFTSPSLEVRTPLDGNEGLDVWVNYDQGGSGTYQHYFSILRCKESRIRTILKLKLENKYLINGNIAHQYQEKADITFNDNNTRIDLLYNRKILTSVKDEETVFNLKDSLVSFSWNTEKKEYVLVRQITRSDNQVL